MTHSLAQVIELISTRTSTLQLLLEAPKCFSKRYREMLLQYYSPNGFSLVQIEPQSRMYTHWSRALRVAFSSVIVINKFGALDGDGGREGGSGLSSFRNYELREESRESLRQQPEASTFSSSLRRQQNREPRMMSKKVELIVKVKLPLCIVSGYFRRYKENYLDENKIWVNIFSS